MSEGSLDLSDFGKQCHSEFFCFLCSSSPLNSKVILIEGAGWEQRRNREEAQKGGFGTSTTGLGRERKANMGVQQELSAFVFLTVISVSVKNM